MRAIIFTSARAACHPVLLIAALLASLIPAWVVSWPIGAIFAQAMDFSADVERLAQRLSIVEIAELIALYRAEQNRIQAHVGVAWICLLIFAPALYSLLSVMQRSNPLRWSARCARAFLDYPRWFFLQLFAFLVWVGFVALLYVSVLALESYQEQIFSLRHWQYVRTAAFIAIATAAFVTHFLHLCARAEYLCDETLHFPPLAYFRALRAPRWRSRMLSYLWLGLIALLMLLVISGLRFIETSSPTLKIAIALAHAGLVSIVAGWLNFARIVCLSHYVRLAKAP